MSGPRGRSVRQTRVLSSPGHARRPQQSNVLSVAVKREERNENPGGNWWLEHHRTISTVRHAFPTTPGPGSLNAVPKLSFLGYLRLTAIIAFSTAKVPEMIAAFPPYLPHRPPPHVSLFHSNFPWLSCLLLFLPPFLHTLVLDWLGKWVAMVDLQKIPLAPGVNSISNKGLTTILGDAYLLVSLCNLNPGLPIC